MNKIPTLLYHAIDTENQPFETKEKGDFIYVVEGKEFEQQIECLRDNGYCAISLDDYVKWSIDGKTGNQRCSRLKGNLSEKSIIFTFDDGYMSNYTRAFPLL